MKTQYRLTSICPTSDGARLDPTHLREEGLNGDNLTTFLVTDLVDHIGVAATAHVLQAIVVAYCHGAGYDCNGAQFCIERME